LLYSTLHAHYFKIKVGWSVRAQKKIHEQIYKEGSPKPEPSAYYYFNELLFCLNLNTAVYHVRLQLQYQQLTSFTKAFYSNTFLINTQLNQVSFTWLQIPGR